MTHAQSTTAEEKDTQETNKEPVSSASGCGQAVHAALGAIALVTEDGAPLQVWEEETHTFQHTEREKATGKESNENKDPEKTIVVDDLRVALEDTIDESTLEPT